MAQETPQTEALSNTLLASDDNIAAFKEDPRPLLEQHGITLSDEEHENLKNHLASNDVATIKMGVSQSGAALMFSKTR